MGLWDRLKERYRQDRPPDIIGSEDVGWLNLLRRIFVGPQKARRPASPSGATQLQDYLRELAATPMPSLGAQPSGRQTQASPIAPTPMQRMGLPEQQAGGTYSPPYGPEGVDRSQHYGDVGTGEEVDLDVDLDDAQPPIDESSAWRPERPAVDFGRPQEPDEVREYGGPEYLRDFLRNGAVLWVRSSWCLYGRWWQEDSTLEIGFKSGWIAFYGPCPMDMALSWARAPSKGKWVWSALWRGWGPRGPRGGRTWIHSVPYVPGAQ